MEQILTLRPPLAPYNPSKAMDFRLLMLMLSQISNPENAHMNELMAQIRDPIGSGM